MMNMSLDEYIEIQNIGIDGTIQGSDNMQRQQQPQASYNQQKNGQKNQFGLTSRNNFKQNRNGNKQGYFQRNVQEHGNLFNRNGLNDMNGNFDLRSRCRRQAQQNLPRGFKQQHQKQQQIQQQKLQQIQQQYHCQQQKLQKQQQLLNGMNSNVDWNLGVTENQLKMCKLNQLHQTGLTNLLMPCGNAMQLQPKPQQCQLSMPMFNGVGNTIFPVPCSSLHQHHQHQHQHGNGIVPLNMNHNHHVLGCQSIQGILGGPVGGCQAVNIGNCLSNHSSTPVIDVLSKILMKND